MGREGVVVMVGRGGEPEKGGHGGCGGKEGRSWWLWGVGWEFGWILGWEFGWVDSGLGIWVVGIGLLWFQYLPYYFQQESKRREKMKKWCHLAMDMVVLPIGRKKGMEIRT